MADVNDNSPTFEVNDLKVEVIEEDHLGLPHNLGRVKKHICSLLAFHFILHQPCKEDLCPTKCWALWYNLKKLLFTKLIKWGKRTGPKKI